MARGYSFGADVSRLVSEIVPMTGFMGRDHVYVIAEIGSNWAGDLDTARTLIHAAKDAGADAVKFQAGHADHVYDPALFPEEHASFKKWVEPTLDVLPQLAAYAEKWGIDFGCSTFCLDALDAVDPFVKWHKVASIEHTWGRFITEVAIRGKPYFVSLGAADGDDDLPADWYPGDAVPLHCTVSYPADLGEVHLRSRQTNGLGEWGLSDHTTHPTIVPCAAVALGASVIEKHIRPNLRDVPFDSPHLREMTPDWPHSLDPAQFREMVDAIRLTEKALGSPEKRIRDSEKPHLKYRRGPRGLRGA